MTFQPTKQQLEELGFNFGGLYGDIDIGKDFKIQVVENVNMWLIYKPSGFGNCIYPQSIDNIKTLIRMLTPPNN